MGQMSVSYDYTLNESSTSTIGSDSSRYNLSRPIFKDEIFTLMPLMKLVSQPLDLMSLF